MDLPKQEQKILKFWNEHKIFEKSLKKTRRGRKFVFYEGPPFANGRPGIHHLLTRAFKDMILRYKTMQGFYVRRKAGWDTHGLPIEMETEKKLGVRTKREIEKIGIEKFIQECKGNVFTYKKEWEDFTRRIGFWLDLKNPYITYDPDYVESVWWILKKIWQKGLLYEDYKVVPYCPRCGTSLSSHEVAQGYKNIREPSIYVKFKITKSKSLFKKGDYLLAWTTTPWTLPANVALAINDKFNYVRIKMNNEFYILAKERLGVIDGDYKVKSTLKGSNLIDLEYEPLFSFSKGKKIVVGADFVSLEEGTGLVHMAPAFGEEDMEVAKKNGLPVLMTIDEEGKFKKEVKPWAGMFVKKADPLIIEHLKKKKLVFKEEEYAHDYPFCWRCDTPLLYYAKKSWFINMQKVKKDLIKNNKKINWIPDYLKEGRFGEWLREVKDWNLTRERYWGTPLPIWKCKECGELEFIGSKKDLLSQKFGSNHYFLMRHGESQCLIDSKISSWPEVIHCPLTNKGKKEIRELAKKLKKEKIDLIFSSDLLRTKQTAEIAAKEVGIKVKFDPRLREVNFGIYNGKELKKYFSHDEKRFTEKLEGGENWNDVKLRILNFIRDLEKKHKGKNVLIITHGGPIWFLLSAVKGLSNKEILASPKLCPGTKEYRKLEFKDLPYNEKGELDFHRPFIDEIKFQCSKCKGVMERAPEVIDCWFDSGSMPYAQWHYPFENRKFIDKKEFFPADFICEGMDQTRGWFYTLLAISTLLGLGISYKNVISHGIVLDDKGQKMSKSKGNIVKPSEVIDNYGADVARFYFYTVNPVGEPKGFDFKDIENLSRRFFGTLWNSFIFFSTYVDQKFKPKKGVKLESALDKWIVSRLESLKIGVIDNLENYNVVGAARLFEDFVDDLSNWYIRRSRKRFQRPESKKDKEEASQVLNLVLLDLVKLLAPFIPFLTEEIYQKLPGLRKERSVHLDNYPKPNKRLINKKLEEKMKLAREVAALVLAERATAGIKVRQPLSKLSIKSKELKNEKELLELIKEEVNVKKIIFDSKKGMKLDLKITPLLKQEGIVREVIHQIQMMRKKAGYKPRHRVSVRYSGSPELNKILTNNKEFILKEIKAEKFEIGDRPKLVFDVEKEIKIDQKKLWLAIRKI